MKVCLGISGGIAAYKSADLLRLLQQQGLEVQVVMTRNACRFVSPLTFAALSGRKVITGMFEEPGREANIESAIEHMAVAQAAELLLIAPATANLLGKMARGIADDFLTTLYLATKAPVVVAPAMNVNMWEHPAVRENVARLRERGVRVVEPEEGYLACGMTGAGRLASLDAILAAALEVLGLRRDLQDEAVLVTAGPTQEPIDPVRFISNRSSGKMGYAIAAAAARRGARTLLISGPTSLPPPDGLEFVDVRTAEQMAQAVLARLEDATIVIKAAAVADFRPVTAAPQKIKKGGGKLSLDLEPTTDILGEIGRRKGRRLVVGFSAETERLQANARKKLEEKKVDLMVANDVTQGVFDSDYNTAVLITRQGATELPRMTKAELAGRILDAVVALRKAKTLKTETEHR
jgi:phosphopantothenoylcysteine decarboxylase/phosphopantothenate--cysteine ligase